MASSSAAIGRQKSAALPTETRTYECARCSRTHNGAATPPGWGYDAGQGVICDDCEEQLRLARTTGMPVRQRAAA